MWLEAAWKSHPQFVLPGAWAWKCCRSTTTAGRKKRCHRLCADPCSRCADGAGHWSPAGACHLLQLVLGAGQGHMCPGLVVWLSPAVIPTWGQLLLLSPCWAQSVPCPLQLPPVGTCCWWRIRNSGNQTWVSLMPTGRGSSRFSRFTGITAFTGARGCLGSWGLVCALAFVVTDVVSSALGLCPDCRRGASMQLTQNL